jgi:anti-anti-sigma regulatory factor
MQPDATQKKTILALPSILTLETIEEFYAEVRKIDITNGAPVVVDAEKLTSITTPGIQIILSIARSVAQSGGAFSINPASRALQDSCRILGLDSEYESWTRIENITGA